jgi:hypothetical protein
MILSDRIGENTGMSAFYSFSWISLINVLHFRVIACIIGICLEGWFMSFNNFCKKIDKQLQKLSEISDNEMAKILEQEYLVDLRGSSEEMRQEIKTLIEYGILVI